MSFENVALTQAKQARIRSRALSGNSYGGINLSSE